MGTNFHTPWQNGVTDWDADDMNPALASLDKSITYKHNFLFHCDGDITWDSGTGVLTWSDKMRIIFISSSGLAIANEIAAGNITIADNEYAYIDLVETNNQVIAVSKASITTGSAAGYKGVARVVLGYRNTASDAFYAVAIKKKLESSLSGVGLELTGYSETEVTVDATSGSANLDYSAGNVFKVAIASSTDTTLTFTNLPTGKACSATIRLEMAGAVPSSISVENKTIDTTGVTSGGEIIVEMQRIGSTWYAGVHHAS